MAHYAFGKKSIAICDRCGQRYPYMSLKLEWTGNKVCVKCYEEKHPQLERKKVVPDAEALHQPRSEAREGVDQPVGDQAVFPPWLNEPMQMIMVLGEVTVVIS